MPLILQDDSFRPLIDAFVADTKARAADGLSLADLGALFNGFIDLCVKEAARLANPGVEKKQLVLECVAVLYDNVAPMIPLPMILQPFRPFVRPYIRQIVIALADGAIEVSYNRLKGN